MKEGLFYRNRSGKETPLCEVSGLSGCGALIVQAGLLLREGDKQRMKAEIEEMLGGNIRVVVLDASITRVMRLEAGGNG